jgi:hypothetical protein
MVTGLRNCDGVEFVSRAGGVLPTMGNSNPRSKKRTTHTLKSVFNGLCYTDSCTFDYQTPT